MPMELTMDQWYREDWEREYELLGPIVETTFIGGHVCGPPMASKESMEHPGRPVDAGGLHFVWEIVGPIVETKRKIVEMGGGVDIVRLPNSTINWTLEEGHDMRNVSELLPMAPFDLVLSSHSLEHIPSRDVPGALKDWIELIDSGGEILVFGPHRCSPAWSPVIYPHAGDPNLDGSPGHLWMPTASCIGNLLISLGLDLLGHEDHRCEQNCWWVHVRRP